VPVVLNWPVPPTPGVHIADYMIWPGTNQIVMLWTDGSVYPGPGVPMYGSAYGQSYFAGQVAASISLLPDTPGGTPGWTITAESGAKYNYGPGLNGYPV